MKRRTIKPTEVIVTLFAAPLTNSSPVLPTLYRGEQFRSPKHGPEKRAQWAAEKAAQRALDAMERKRFSSEPVHERFCRAVAKFAEHADRNTNSPALVKAVDAIRRAAPGWEWEDDIMRPILTAVADQWAIEWTEGNPDRS